MSVMHDDLAAPPMEAAIRSRTLLRRLMIRCPVTGLAADTGFELSEVPQVSAQQQILVDCLECGQDHEWRAEDLRLG